MLLSITLSKELVNIFALLKKIGDYSEQQFFSMFKIDSPKRGGGTILNMIK